MDTFELSFELTANIRVNPPTRPKNISIIRTSFEIRHNWEVIPKDNPTVPTADEASKKAVGMGMPSTVLMKIPPNKKRIRYIIRIAAAFFIVSGGKRRPKHWALSRRRNTEIMAINRTAAVVVFIPPAVEPGDPPISISITIIACPA